MSTFCKVCWWAVGFALGCFCWLLVGLGVQAAMGATLSDPTDYLAKHGLSAELVPYREVPAGKVAGTPLDASTDEGTLSIGFATHSGYYCPPGNSCTLRGVDHGPGVWVYADQDPINRAQAALHEWLHAVSNGYVWRDVYCDETPGLCEGPAFVLLEEGLVEAASLHHLPNWWRAVGGKPLRRPVLADVRTWPGYGEARVWIGAAARATGTRRWSREARAWLDARLTEGLDARATSLTEALNRGTP